MKRVRRARTRVLLVLVLLFGCVGVQSTLLAPSAVAGGVDAGTGDLTAAVYNVTPYQWTLVAIASPTQCNFGSCWDTPPANTIPPGGASGYKLLPNLSEGGGICFGNYEYGFDAYFTYRVDVLGGPPEYQTVAISQAETHGLCFGGDNHPRLDVFDTTAPPPPGYDPASSPGTAPATPTTNPQVTYTHNVPFLFDQSFQITGNYTVDASTNLGQPFVNVLNQVCVAAANTSCSFTQIGPLTWGIGAPGGPQDQSTNCSALGSAPALTAITYTTSQTASLTVGGGVTVSAKFNLFGVIASEASVSVEAQHEWQEVKSISKTAQVSIPPQGIATVWVVPVVGTVTGTLTLSNGTANFTVTNFSEQRSGVTKDPLTPAFNAITQVRAMSAPELASHCRLAAAPKSGVSANKHLPLTKVTS